MFADSRFDYLSQARYYAAMVVTPIQFVANLPSRASLALSETMRSRTDLQEENQRLREELFMQRYQLQKLEHLIAENERLTDLLKSSAVVDDVVVRAQLTGESPDPYIKRILINKGSRDGVFVGQPVLDASGLMGQVVEVEPFSSWVLLITDPQHSTPVQINRNGMRAIASGTRNGLHQLTLDNIPNTEDVREGDVLVTSGLGGRFPAGYPVGVVSEVHHDPGKPFADVLVTPTAQITRSRDLLLVFEDPEGVSSPYQPVQDLFPQEETPQEVSPQETPAPAASLLEQSSQDQAAPESASSAQSLQEQAQPLPEEDEQATQDLPAQETSAPEAAEEAGDGE